MQHGVQFQLSCIGVIKLMNFSFVCLPVFMSR